MKKIPLALFFLFIFMGFAHAQTAQQVLPGYLQLTGCPGGGRSSPCYQYQANPVRSAATEGSHVLKSGAGTLFGLSVTASAAGYVLVYNATSAPSDGAVTPIACYYNSSGPGTLGVAFTPFPLQFTTGITVVYSSTGCFTQTTSSTAFFLGEVL